MNHDVVIYGAGSVGSSIGGWIAPHHKTISLLARGENALAIKRHGLVVYTRGRKARPAPIPVPVIGRLAERPDADIVVITVKNYDLEAAADDIKKSLKVEPLVVALQNGLENRKILPRSFSRVVYGIVCYNSRREAPGVVRANSKGPVLLGVPGNDRALIKDVETIRELFSRGLDTRVTTDFSNAAMTKMIMNLTNAILTLVGLGYREIESMRALKHIVTGALLEGIEIAGRAGYREASVPGAPTKRLLRFLSRLPEPLSDFMFSGTIRKIDLNSMGQDILQFRRGRSELESLTGFFVSLADSLDLPAPYNRTILELCTERFGHIPFEPLPERDVWEHICRRLANKRAG